MSVYQLKGSQAFNRSVQDIKARNANTDPEELQRLIENAVNEVRAERRAKREA